MNKIVLNIAIVTLLIPTSLLTSPSLYAGESETFWSWLTTFSRQKGVKPVDDALYLEECGACHFAYQPGLLPAGSWEKLLTPEALADHFGDSAELEAQDLTLISDYVFANSADKSYFKRSRQIVHATREVEPPLRITDVKYIRRRHHEIPDKLIKDNPDVVSLINCNACHTKADEGNFDDDTVSIPNHGVWDE